MRIYDAIDEYTRGYWGCALTWLLIGSIWIIVYLGGWLIIKFIEAAL